jgi:hypothetical protein
MLIIGLPFCALTTNKARGGARYFLYYTLARSNRAMSSPPPRPPRFQTLGTPPTIFTYTPRPISVCVLQLINISIVTPSKKAAGGQGDQSRIPMLLSDGFRPNSCASTVK